MKSEKVPDFVFCPYCHAENIVQSITASLKNISGMLYIKYLTDNKILYNEFRNAYNKHFIGIIIGLIVFYGSFFAFTCFWEDMNDIHFLVHNVAMPFVVLILLHLISELTSVPFFKIDDWLPEYFSENMEEKHETNIEIKRPSIVWLIPFAKILFWLLFCVSLFFMR